MMASPFSSKMNTNHFPRPNGHQMHGEKSHWAKPGLDLDNKLHGSTLARTKGTPKKLHHGLVNQGATCYLNSILQVLFVTTEIHERLAKSSEMIDLQLRNVFEALKKETHGTENITKMLQIENIHLQLDAAECLELILNKINTQASEVFQGQLTYTTKCSEGHIINEETNPFWTLPLSLKDSQDPNFSVANGFKRIFQMKLFKDENLVYCNECNKKTEATCVCEMVKSPQILILLLKRFDFDYSTMSHVKSHCCVDVPSVIKPENKNQIKKYKLYGMVNHMGGLSGGHYTAIVRSKKYKTWYEFDDDKIHKAGVQPKQNYNSCTAYLLMYRGKCSKGKRWKEAGEKLKLKGKKNVMSNEGITGNVTGLGAAEATQHFGPEEPKAVDEQKGERNTEHDETTQTLVSEHDEGQMRKERQEELQATGEVGGAASVRNELSINGCTAVSEVRSTGGEDVSEHDEGHMRNYIKEERHQVRGTMHTLVGGHDEGQMRKDQKEERQQARGTGGEEVQEKKKMGSNKKPNMFEDGRVNDASVGQWSPDRHKKRRTRDVGDQTPAGTSSNDIDDEQSTRL